MYEGSLCVCCMSTDELVDLHSSRVVENLEENYAKILTCCLNINISEDDGHDSICEPCILKLRYCVSFKTQILKSISVLSSIDIKELMNVEELQVLGVKTTNLQSNVTEIDQVENAEDVNCTQHDADSVIDLDDPDSKDSNPIHTPAPSVLKRRQKGRPRVHQPDSLPYKIQSDEMKCRECGEEFPNHKTLKVHYNKHFSNHVCKTCNKGFIKLGSLKKHESSHQIGPFLCEICKQEFRNINTLYSHKRYKHSKTLPFKCKDCSKRFTTLQQRLAHASVAHAQTERRYECRYCHQKFRYSGECSKHIANKHEVKLFPCPLCGVKYKRRYLRAHLLVRHDIGDGYSCEECGAKRASRSALSEHMRRHFDDRRFICKLCNQGFVQKCTLKYHVEAHVRRGDYHGDPYCLIATNENETGILSEHDSLDEPDKTWSDDRIRLPKDHVGSPKVCVGSPEDPARSLEDPAESLKIPAESLEDPAGSPQDPDGSLENRAKSLEDPAKSLEHRAESLKNPAESREDPGISPEVPCDSPEDPAVSLEDCFGSLEDRFGSPGSEDSMESYLFRLLDHREKTFDMPLL